MRWQALETVEVLPDWLRTYCPGVKRVVLTDHIINPYGRLTGSEDDDQAGAPPAPLACPHLEHVAFIRYSTRDDHMHFNDDRRQLAAQPSLTSVRARAIDWLEDADGPALSTLKKLHLDLGRVFPLPASFPTVLPQLEELHMDCLVVDDAGLGVLRSMPRLRRLTMDRFELEEESHARTAWDIDHLDVETLDVRSLVRLPLEGIRQCTYRELVAFRLDPDWDERKVAHVWVGLRRVRAALQRWGGWGADQLLIESL